MKHASGNLRRACGVRVCVRWCWWPRPGERGDSTSNVARFGSGAVKYSSSNYRPAQVSPVKIHRMPRSGLLAGLRFGSCSAAGVFMSRPPCISTQPRSAHAPHVPIWIALKQALSKETDNIPEYPNNILRAYIHSHGAHAVERHDKRRHRKARIRRTQVRRRCGHHNWRRVPHRCRWNGEAKLQRAKGLCHLRPARVGTSCVNKIHVAWQGLSTQAKTTLLLRVLRGFFSFFSSSPQNSRSFILIARSLQPRARWHKLS